MPVVVKLQWDGKVATVLFAADTYKDQSGKVLKVDEEFQAGRMSVYFREEGNRRFVEIQGPENKETFPHYKRHQNMELGLPGQYNIAYKEKPSNHPNIPNLVYYGYRVKDPSEESDPMLRMLREEKMPLSILKKVGEGPLDLYLLWNNPWKTEWLVTDGAVERTMEVNHLEEAPRQDNCLRGIHVEGGNYAVVVLDYENHGFSRFRVQRIYVREGCKPGTIRGIIQKVRSESSRTEVLAQLA